MVRVRNTGRSVTREGEGRGLLLAAATDDVGPVEKVGSRLYPGVPHLQLGHVGALFGWRHRIRVRQPQHRDRGTSGRCRRRVLPGQRGRSLGNAASGPDEILHFQCDPGERWVTHAAGRVGQHDGVGAKHCPYRRHEGRCPRKVRCRHDRRWIGLHAPSSKRGSTAAEVCESGSIRKQTGQSEKYVTRVRMTKTTAPRSC